MCACVWPSPKGLYVHLIGAHKGSTWPQPMCVCVCECVVKNKARTHIIVMCCVCYIHACGKMYYADITTLPYMPCLHLCIESHIVCTCMCICSADRTQHSVCEYVLTRPFHCDVRERERSLLFGRVCLFVLTLSPSREGKKQTI